MAAADGLKAMGPTSFEQDDDPEFVRLFYRFDAWNPNNPNKRGWGTQHKDDLVYALRTAAKVLGKATSTN